MKVMDSF